MHTHTARNFALQLGALISLYVSLSFLLVLLFGIINLSFPDPAERYWAVESAQSNIRLGVAMVVVFFPTYVLLTRTVNRIRRHEPTGSYLTLTKWLVYLSLLAGGGVLLGDLVAVIMTYLEGEITQRFILKALAVLVVIGAAFYYYLRDAVGYWNTHEGPSIALASGATLIVLASLIYGVWIVDAPSTVQERAVDQRQITDLQNIERHIVDQLRSTNELPETITDAYSSGVATPTAPAGREEYEYHQTENGYELCAEFTHPSEPSRYTRPTPPLPDERSVVIGAGTWEHGTGRHCFSRTVNLSTTTQSNG